MLSRSSGMYSCLYSVLPKPTEVSAISVSVSDIIVEGSPSPTHTALQRYVPPKNRYVGNPLLPVYGLSAHRDCKNCSRCGVSMAGHGAESIVLGYLSRFILAMVLPEHTHLLLHTHFAERAVHHRLVQYPK